MSNNKYDVIIIGAGAAGLMCAAALYNADSSLRVLVLEKNSKPGRKLLATGNGRCNYTNRNVTSSCYNTDDNAKLTKILHAFGPAKITSFFENNLGIITDYKNDLAYPITYQSKTVADALASASNARFEYDTEVKSVVREGMNVIVNGVYTALYVVFACGGVSLPDSGSDGSLYPVLKGMAGSDSFERLIPSLVPLKSSDKDLRKLSGIRQECIVKMDGREERGEILFTDYGISGICVMQLSGYYNRSLTSGKPVKYLTVDLIPSMDLKTKKKVIGDLLNRFDDRDKASAISGLIKKPIAEVAVARSDGTPDGIASVIHDFRINLTGSLGFENAQVTSGGLKLSAVTDGLELKKCPGIFVCGEALNVDGLCGGYNLHWAWASAMTVAESIYDEYEEI
ncbi:MAG: aminoacetone oxidase family FAD-binding enzyme [Clostridiales bacterium]|nr:aminoacetone oxidase family FAD-binding enzyme [Clostridiales bacterium]